jgi:hypothetical protein
MQRAMKPPPEPVPESALERALILWPAALKAMVEADVREGELVLQLHQNDVVLRCRVGYTGDNIPF